MDGRPPERCSAARSTADTPFAYSAARWGQAGEEGKSAVRAHRQAALTGLKKAEGSEEERERAKHRLQAVVDEAVAEIARR